jgi:hypothetical protein
VYKAGKKHAFLMRFMQVKCCGIAVEDAGFELAGVVAVTRPRRKWCGRALTEIEPPGTACRPLRLRALRFDGKVC